MRSMGTRTRRWRRALQVTRVARQTHLLRVLREIGLAGERTATVEGAQQFRQALEELGTTYVKLGQLLSSRPDLLPDVYIEELGRLVDEVPAVPFGVLRPVIEADLGPDVFTVIDEEPLAAASIAQIHAALLKDGREVVIKARRPGVVEQVAVDLDLLRSTAGLLEGKSETARLLQVRALADELETHLKGELNFVEEAHNTEVIGGLVAEDVEELVVPKVIRPWVTERVLVLERLHGARVGPQHGLTPERASRLARTFFRAYVRQVTIEGIYHADPHRGNVLLTEDGRLGLLDFGLLGRLDDDTRRNLALLLMAVAQNRADDVADLILGLSLTTVGSDPAAFVHDLRRKLPRYHWRPLSGIATGDALADLQRLAVTHGIRLPTSFALVGKTLAQADSIARTLDPQLDPVQLLANESLEVMLVEAERRLAPRQFLGTLYTQLEPMTKMPRRVGMLVNRLEEGSLKVGIAPTDLDDVERVLRSVANRLGAAMIVVGLLISSALMARVNDGVALAGFIVSGALALYMVWKILRTPGDL
jgi:predicted unusual protein kinase regulating ubiquinone biosynthesis (AarF/ABC1/UbiB family)